MSELDNVAPYASQLKKQTAPSTMQKINIQSELGTEVPVVPVPVIPPIVENPLPPKEVIVPPVVETEKPKAPDKAKSVLSSLDSLTDLDEKVTPVEPEKPKTKEANFREVTRLREEAESRVKDLQAQLDSINEVHNKRIAELEQSLEQTAFEKSPKFKSKYQAPLDAAMDRLKSFATELGEDPSIAQQAMSLKGRERMLFIDEKFGGGAASAEMLRLVNETELHNANLNQALANYKETKVEITNADKQSAEQEHKQIMKTFDSTVEQLSTRLSYFKQVDGDTEHNSEVESRIEHAKAIITGEAPQEDIMLAPFLAVVAKSAIARCNAMAAELQKYKARVKEEGDVSLGIRNGTLGDTKITPGKPQSALEMTRQALG